jgi:twitching motility protein PilI
MANKEALRELQTRLAERMQQARTQERSQSWLAVECRSHGFLLPLDQAGEIFPVAPLTPVAHARPWFLGVANLRGGLHGVVDLARFLGLAADAPRESGRDQARWVALGAAAGLNCALQVDRLLGLRSADQLTPHAWADGSVRPAFASGQWTDAQQRPWQTLDLAALASDEHFLSVAL